MSVIDTLITDRTVADTAAVKALNSAGLADWTAEQTAAYLAGMKGSYNASDLNRVGEACAYLYGLFTGYGYDVPGYAELRTSWTAADIPTAAELTTYLATVAALRAVLQASTAIPETMSGLTVDGANSIERLLTEIDGQIRRMAQIFVYSGTVYSGMIWSQFGG